MVGGGKMRAYKIDLSDNSISFREYIDGLEQRIKEDRVAFEQRYKEDRTAFEQRYREDRLTEERRYEQIEQRYKDDRAAAEQRYKEDKLASEQRYKEDKLASEQRYKEDKLASEQRYMAHTIELEKLRQADNKLFTEKVDKLDEKLDAFMAQMGQQKYWFIGVIVAIILAFAGTIIF